MVILVATDQHLGYTRSNSKEFSDFLDAISKRNDITDFVLLGDLKISDSSRVWDSGFSSGSPHFAHNVSSRNPCSTAFHTFTCLNLCLQSHFFPNNQSFVR